MTVIGIITTIVGRNMKNLVAKPIIKDQYWVITDGKQKVGNVVADGSGFDVKLNGQNFFYKNTTDIERKTQIEFETPKTTLNKKLNLYDEYPTTNKTYNNVFDLKRKIHLYTKTSKSKCYYASGYYLINQNDELHTVFCPKYIFLQRYPYYGPYKTEEEAKTIINTLCYTLKNS